MVQKFDAGFLEKVLNQVSSNLFISDLETHEIVYMNECMKKTFEEPHPEGKKCWEVLQKGVTEQCSFCKAAMLLQDETKQCVWKHRNTVTNQIYKNCDWVEYSDGKAYHVQQSIDITNHLQLSVEAAIDELTGVLNRNAGKKRLEDTLRTMKNEDMLVVAMYDMNGLKWVNDTYGHQEGDRMLCFTAQNVRKELDDSDFIFRLSGDEFVLVFKNKTVAEADEWIRNVLSLIEERRIMNGITRYEICFSYGMVEVHANDHMTVSDVLSVADSQMYAQKRNHHIKMGKLRLREAQGQQIKLHPFKYNRDYLFEALSDSMEDYLFIGNLKTSEFIYSYKMVNDFGLPGQVIANAAAFWGERIHPEDVDYFLKSNQEIADGRAEQHAITYRAKNAAGEWVRLLCKGKMVRDKMGRPDLFAGTIRNLDRVSEQIAAAKKDEEFLSRLLCGDLQNLTDTE